MVQKGIHDAVEKEKPNNIEEGRCTLMNETDPGELLKKLQTVYAFLIPNQKTLLELGVVSTLE